MDDPADLDGDGQFNAIDISIIEEDRGAKRPTNNNGGCGCCVLLFVLGSALGAAGWWGVNHYLT